ncbi:uroporphyrinogen-III synthase [Microlunatus parietis]|uniref:Uroporphyrinogen-III synthase n=1 Tax=Microlunatus parietis TaxID=682979 RepID=A0A7Y9ICK0_9ACTN|nr:uroporphyrinogen-III synthase [Microlunatus parietis]NYE74106.1 uroporphyrinogen-III synthase [Microlunatus parietis]
MNATVPALQGFRVGVTSDRRSEDLITALERRGAEVLHAPSLRIAVNESDASLIEDTRRLIAARPEFVLITTGYGMHRWLEVADVAGLGAELIDTLERSRVLARGPKALGAIRAAGLDEASLSDAETTASLVDAVIAAGPGRRVGIQLHGYTDEVQLARLRSASAAVHTVAPYRWAPVSGDDRSQRLIDAVCDRALDALTFTSAPAADATLALARSSGRWSDFLSALRSDVITVAVGPVTAGPLTEAGIDVIMPDRYRMGALIRLVCDRLNRDRVRRYRTLVGDAEVLELRGQTVRVGDRQVRLGPTALALFRRLADAESAVLSREQLVEGLSDQADTHALEVAISRLRRSLGVPDLISTVIKRGYRMNVRRLTAPETACAQELTGS